MIDPNKQLACVICCSCVWVFAKPQLRCNNGQEPNVMLHTNLKRVFKPIELDKWRQDQVKQNYKRYAASLLMICDYA